MASKQKAKPNTKAATTKSADALGGLKKDKLLELYEMMLLIRRFEERAGQLYGMGLIGGFCHLYIGQEAVVVGLQSALKPTDAVITSYRDHGHMLACGMSSRGVMAELTGREGGYSKGKGGSMHMFSKEKNFFGGHGIVGAQVPLGAGIAFAHKYRGNDSVCMSYLGDGAVNQGQVYEAFNMAALWKLPVIFVIENNHYAMGTSVPRAVAGQELYKRGAAYGIPGVKIDGMDVLAVREAGMMAVEHCRSGKGPMIIEASTYRFRGHSMSDPATYRSKEEVADAKERRDPIKKYLDLLISQKAVKDEDLKKIEKEIKATVLDAVEFAKTSPLPDSSELYTDVLVEASAN